MMVCLNIVCMLFIPSVIILTYATEDLTQCSDTRHIDDTYLAHDVYDSSVGSSLMDCVARCFAHSRCLSVGFEPETLECHRHTQNSSLAPDSLVAVPGWIHSDVDMWPETILGACSGTTCDASEECMVSRAGLPICIKVTAYSEISMAADFPGGTHCPSPPPSLTNANVSDGMQLVGSVRTYTCLHGYLDLSSDSVTANTTCLQNLTWSHAHLQCSGPWIRKNTLSTPREKYVQLTTEELKNTFVNSSLIFQVKTCHDANFNFGKYQAVPKSNVDRVIIGGSDNTVIQVRVEQCPSVYSYGIVSCTEYKPFWVKLNGSTISVGKGNRVGYGQQVICTDPDIELIDVSISTYVNNAGTWLFKIRSVCKM